MKPVMHLYLRYLFDGMAGRLDRGWRDGSCITVHIQDKQK